MEPWPLKQMGHLLIKQVASATTLVFDVTQAPNGAITATSARLFARSEGYQQHRAVDGGVLITTGANSVGAQQTRQTRRYFRYQSGKGLQISSGTIMKPNLNLESITSSGTTVTVVTKDAHNIQPGVPGSTRSEEHTSELQSH